MLPFSGGAYGEARDVAPQAQLDKRKDRQGTRYGPGRSVAAEADARACRSLCRPGVLAGMGYVPQKCSEKAGMNCPDSSVFGKAAV